MNYNQLVSKFQLYMKVNGIDTNLDRENYVFGGSSNKGFSPVCINLPLFNYDDINNTDFFENQKNYDLSICRTNDENDKSIVQVSVLLKDLYSDNLCPESEFITILNKIKNLKLRFLHN